LIHCPIHSFAKLRPELIVSSVRRGRGGKDDDEDIDGRAAVGAQLLDRSRVTK